MNYSHILTVEIWSDKIQQTSNYGNILNHVKNAIVNDIQTYEVEYNGKKQLYSLFWKNASWDIMNTNLYNGDIVIEKCNLDDNIIYLHTVKMLKDIEAKLYIDKKTDGDFKIIFSIVKPVIHYEKCFVENIKFVDL
jgi:hypothetical protein